MQDSYCHFVNLLQLTGLKYSISFLGELLKPPCTRPGFSSSYAHTIEPHNLLQLRHPSSEKYMFFLRSGNLCCLVVQQLWPRQRGTFRWSFFPNLAVSGRWLAKYLWRLTRKRRLIVACAVGKNTLWWRSPGLLLEPRLALQKRISLPASGSKHKPTSPHFSFWDSSRALDPKRSAIAEKGMPLNEFRIMVSKETLVMQRANLTRPQSRPVLLVVDFLLQISPPTVFF